MFIRAEHARMEVKMDRLKELGTWVILVIAFYLFSNGLIYIALHNGSVKPINEANNAQITTQKK